MNEEVEDLERRLRIVRIRYQDVLSMFSAANNKPERLSLPKLKNLPAGYEVIAVDHDFASQSFQFLIRHQEFSPIEHGYNIPVLSGVEVEIDRTIYIRDHQAEVAR